MWAATATRLVGLGGVYCEDCDLAEPAPADGTEAGVRDYACNLDQAARLWTLAVKLTATEGTGGLS